MHLKITDAPYFAKIPVRLKISVSLKISVRSDNPYLKISVHQWASRPEWCKCSGHLQRIAGSTGRKAGERQRESRRGCRNTRPPKESRRATNKEIFCLYIGIIAPNEKYLQKMLKKICRYQNLLYLCNQKQQTK